MSDLADVIETCRQRAIMLFQAYARGVTIKHGRGEQQFIHDVDTFTREIAAAFAFPAPPLDDVEVRATLSFKIDDANTLHWADGGCRPASEPEIEMWHALSMSSRARILEEAAKVADGAADLARVASMTQGDWRKARDMAKDIADGIRALSPVRKEGEVQ